MSNPKEIPNEIANLYDKNVDHSGEIWPFLSTVNTSKLSDEQHDSMDKQLTISE